MYRNPNNNNMCTMETYLITCYAGEKLMLYFESRLKKVETSALLE